MNFKPLIPKLIKRSFFFSFFQGFACCFVLAQDSPYPKSTLITSIQIDWSTHQRHALGSDNFALTWADDDNQYGPWGDGGGFKGTNDSNRVSLGIARIEGSSEKYNGFNRYGHPNSSEYLATLIGKSWGILCVDGVLYMWVHPDNINGYGVWKDHHKESKLYYSIDKGGSWQATNWKFTKEDGLLGGGILQYGRDYQGAPDEYTYHYFSQPNFSTDSAGNITELQIPGRVYLARVHKRKVLNRSAYMFFKKMRKGKPVWTRKIEEKNPVFEDKNGVGTPIAICYNPGLKRYLFTSEHTQGEHGNFGLFESPTPWGPWSTVIYMSFSKGFAFGYDNKEQVPPNTFFWTFPTKWMSENGQNLILTFTGAGQGKNNDSFNTVKVFLSKK